jgi:hypothetical protein
LVDARAEAGVAGELRGRREAVDVADLGSDRVGEHPADARDGEQQPHVAVVGAEPAQLRLAGRDLAIKLVDQAQAGGESALPWLGELEPGEQLAPADAEQVGDRAGLAVRKQDRVHALLQARTVTDHVQTPTRALGSVLQASGASPFTFCASAISTCQPATSSRSCTKRAPFMDSIAGRIGSP